YDDAWTLSGFALRENHGVDLATVYQDPSAPSANANNDAVLTALASGLDNSFLAARDCDVYTADKKCIGNGQADITVDEIRRRFDRAKNAGVPAQARWGLQNIFRVSVPASQYGDIDQAMITTAMTTTPALLNAAFASTAARPISPTL